MERLSFYFDPLCPWAWLTSLWIREVRAQNGIDVEWKFFSLAEVNELEVERFGPLRTAALARQEGGNEAVDRAYLALGRLIHESPQKVDLAELATAAEEPLRQEGLDPTLARRALADDSTREAVLADHREAVDRYGAFGVPWLAVSDGGFFGPVVGELLKGEKAVELWKHVQWALQQPYLFELKRGRQPLPRLRHTE